MNAASHNVADAETAGLTTDDAKWRAVVERDRTADGLFYFSVLSTGVYCRPSCGARHPRRENVSFHADCAEAEQAGFRACKRCRPRETTRWSERVSLIEHACRYIEQAAQPPALSELSQLVGLSPYHFHRVFKEVTGVTPRAYAAGRRAATVREKLRAGKTISGAVYDAGYGANSRFYAESDPLLGMRPKAFRAGGAGEQIRYSVRSCSFGSLLLAATDKGICSLQLGDDAATLTAALCREFPGAKVAAADTEFEAWVEAALELVNQGRQSAAELPLDIRGTAFQQRVWAALQTIPRGSTATYREIAEQIGSPSAARAVARACASNRIAIVIPCHRVVPTAGGSGGYRWGAERKAALLAREKKSPE